MKEIVYFNIREDGNIIFIFFKNESVIYSVNKKKMELP